MMVKYIEFQAIVLAGGKGSRMTELTAGKPKCLLPIHNIPMIYYPLHSLEKAGFTEAIVIVTEDIKKEVSVALDKLGMNIKLDLVGIPDGEDLGTVDAIRYIHDKINKNLIVMSCDLIAEIDVGEIVNSFRKNNASITALMIPAPKIPSSFITPGPKSKHKPETDLIGIDNKTNRLMFVASASDFEETIDIPQQLLRKHTSFTIHSKLMDAHFYVIQRWVADFVIHNKNFVTFKGELLPYIVRKQLSRPKQYVDDRNTSIVKMSTRDDIHHFAVEHNLDELIRKMSVFNDHKGDLEGAYHDDSIRCYAHIETNEFGLRANTVQMYSYANSMPLEHPLFNTRKDLISLFATVKSTQIKNCRVGEGALVDEKTSIEDTHIGSNSIIETKTRVLNSVIMRNVTIKQRCVIVNCILCNGCIIEEGSRLSDCLVGAQHVITAGSHHTREVLTDTDRLMEI